MAHYVISREKYSIDFSRSFLSRTVRIVHLIACGHNGETIIADSLHWRPSIYLIASNPSYYISKIFTFMDSMDVF